MTIIEEAIQYAKQGWKILPLKKGTKLPQINAWQENASDDMEQIVAWWEDFPNSNIGVQTGSVSGIWVLDIDVKGAGDGIDSLDTLTKKHGSLPETLLAKTASGGYHYFFKMPNFDLRNTAGTHPGIDSRANGGYVVLPGSKLHDGTHYRFINPGTSVADAPQWLYDELVVKKDYNGPLHTEQRNYNEGGRNNSLFLNASSYRGRGLEYNQILTLLRADNQQCKPPLDDEEVVQIAQSVAGRYEPEPQHDPGKLSELLQFVNPLGVDDSGSYVFYPKNLRCVKSFGASTIMQTPTLYSIIGEKLLYKFFPNVNEEGETVGFSVKKAALFLMEQCHRKGTYDPDLMRGIGVWKDDKRIVVNTGDKLIIDGKETPYDDFLSDYTYAQPGKDLLRLNGTAEQDDIDLLWKMINGFNWSAPYHPYLLLGALVQASIAPIFRWRSHIWIVGAQGSGKSYVQFNLIRPLLGTLCKGFEHGTTSSGIRQSLKHNAFTVSYDEAEVREGDDPRNMQQVVALARISSSEESTVVKGSASGDAVEYRCQSTFIMSSIKPYLKQESDLARFALLELEPDISGSDQFDNDVIANLDKIDSGFSAKWLRYCIDAIPNVLEIRKHIDKKMIESGLSPRTRDQYGQLIACASAVLGEDSVDMSLFDNVLDGTKDFSSEAEPLRELSRLLNEVIDIPSKHGSNRITVLNAIKIATSFMNTDYVPDEVNDRLCSYGLKVHKGYLYIANTSSKLEKIMGSPNWNNLFKIIPWFEVGKNCTTFGVSTYKSRHVKCEINRLFDEKQQNQQGSVARESSIDAGF